MNIQLRSLCFIITFLLTFSVVANAQTGAKSENGKESLGKQYKNNRVPGLKYAPGTGTSVKSSSNSVSNTVSTQPGKNQSTLASDKKAELKKEETPTVKPVVPTQENTQENSNKKQL